MTSGPQKQKKQKRPKPPKRVRVANVTYNIVIDEVELHKKIIDVDLHLYGYCEVEQANIYIKPGLAPDIERDTLCHELGHAVWSAVGLTEGKRKEEGYLCAFVPTYIDMLNRNPKLRKYLFND